MAPNFVLYLCLTQNILKNHTYKCIWCHTGTKQVNISDHFTLVMPGPFEKMYGLTQFSWKGYLCCGRYIYALLHLVFWMEISPFHSLNKAQTALLIYTAIGTWWRCRFHYHRQSVGSPCWSSKYTTGEGQKGRQTLFATHVLSFRGPPFDTRWVIFGYFAIFVNYSGLLQISQME